MPIETKNLTAVLLAGGKSIRMGTDKAALPHPVSKIPLLVRQLDLLTELGLARLLVSARDGQVLPPYPHEVGRVNDHGESGPLGGIVAALAATSTPHLLVLPIDLPEIDIASLHRLLADCDPHRGAVATTSDGTEPLIAIYPRRVLPEFQLAIQQSRLGLRRLLQEPAISAHFKFTYFDPYPAAFHNWNTPA